MIFQLTTSHRGRLAFARATDFAEVFQLTTSHRGRLLALHLLKSRFKFQLTTSHRGRQWKRVLENPKKNFNSLPHTEVDGKK